MSEVNNMIDHVMLSEPEKRRPYLGMSQIGNPDERMLWLNFRWCLEPTNFEPRISRILDLGNLLEDQIVDYLKKIEDIEVFEKDKRGNQYTASLLGDHFSGHIDGVVKGMPEEEQPMILEIKTANEKRFNNLVSEKSYERWSMEYEAQIHCYMGAFNLDKSLALVYNKNNSDIYTEVIDKNEEMYKSMVEKARRIITAEQPPESLIPETDWRIKNMPKGSRDVYMQREYPTEKNCRNCKYSQPIIEASGATWRCNKDQRMLNVKMQAEECKDHEWITGLTPLPF
tara:strand:+ start:239 stop:1090 length:852 start_codon:yes stop_codon:yes gene_type:complete